MATEEERRDGPEQECLYKTKVVQFLGRTIPVILQNDNGPCPLLAICNVLLLKNNLNLSLDISEVSLQKLLSLVAERLIDSNSNVENKDAGYVKNQQQNIADAIDLLPRLATGIDVNIQFRRIDDFEFTRECAIFDLLDIPLYHGWIVDPQDYDTANAIGSKSYNTLTGELVALDTRNTERELKNNSEEDCIDFAAATTAALGVPTPCLLRARSLDDSPGSVHSHQNGRKGDKEEEAELLRALKLSEVVPTLVDESPSADANQSTTAEGLDEGAQLKSSGLGTFEDTVEGHIGDEHRICHQQEPSILQECNASSSCTTDVMSWEAISRTNNHSPSKIDTEFQVDQSNSKEAGECFISTGLMDNIRTDSPVQNPSEPCLLRDMESSSEYKDHSQHPEGEQQVQPMRLQDTPDSEIHLVLADNSCDSTVLSDLPAPNADFDFSSGRSHLQVPDGLTSSLDSTEPIYEGEECMLDSRPTIYENQEPMYEGEMVLAEQADRGTIDNCDEQTKDEITQQQGELIKNFLKNSASQLTIYGLFCLQEGLKERELCVFFRNNHFSTMFKFNGELYLLATDQGYINQSDLVWEKLNEVNGDTVFMTSNFKEFKVENHGNDTWDEHNALASTADYLASIDTSAAPGSTLNSDLQLAIALQQQEFDQQPQRHNSQQSSTSGGSRLVTGPQAPKSSGSNSSSKQESKSKDKCVVM